MTYMQISLRYGIDTSAINT